MPEQNGLEKQIAVHFNFEVTYDFWSSYSKSIESETFWGTLGDNAYEDLYIHNCERQSRTERYRQSGLSKFENEKIGINDLE